MDIIKAPNNYAPLIMEMINQCVKDMQEKGIFQWNEFYPNIETVNNDILSDTAYIIQTNSLCIATVTLNEVQSPEYKEINWLKQDGIPLVVHRLAVHPLYQNQGLARGLMLFSEKYAIQNGYTSIRLDTYSANPYAIRLYEKLGYQHLGQVFFPQRELPFFCMEKVL